MIVDTKYQFGVGIPIESTARNGKIADGANVARLAAYINMIAAQRMKILAFAGNSLALPITNTLTPRVKFHTSPNCGGVEAIMVLGPGTSATAFGAYTWTIGGIAQITRLITGNTGGVNGLNDLVVRRLQARTVRRGATS